MVTKAKDFSSERFWGSEDLYKSRLLQIKAFAMKGLGRWTGQARAKTNPYPALSRNSCLITWLE